MLLFHTPPLPPQYLIASLVMSTVVFPQVLPIVHNLSKVHQNIFRPVTGLLTISLKEKMTVNVLLCFEDKNVELGGCLAVIQKMLLFI